MPETDDSPWTDPNVVAALKNGRPPSDIALLSCPRCGVLGYYNEGSHFSCRACGSGFAVLSEGESHDGPALHTDGVITLDDFASAAPEGYEANDEPA